MNRARILILLTISTILFLSFWAKASIALDPDFGFRVKNGLKIVEGGLQRTDPYSYTMPSFAFVEHAYLIALSWGYLYMLAGYSGIAFFQTLIVLSAMFFLYLRSIAIVKKYIYTWLVVSVYILSAGALFVFFGVRAQIVSWFLFALLFYLLFPKSQWQRFKPWIPVLFFIWANTHGSFLTGLIILTTTVVIRWIAEKHFIFTDLLIIAISCAVTLINPYGLGIWHESYITMTDANLRTYIFEWMPPFFSINLAIGTYAVFAIIFIGKYFRIFSIEERIVLGLTLISALSSTRNIPIAILFSVPMLIAGAYKLQKDTEKIPQGLYRLGILSSFLLVIILMVVSVQIVLDIQNSRTLQETTAFPKRAIYYLKSNLPEGRIFSQFYWGGYLIWKLPEKRVFIDGRMTSWRNTNAPEEESSAVFLDYIDLIDGTIDYKEVFNKYGINTVLWSTPHESKVHTPTIFSNMLSKQVQNTKPDYDLFSSLEEDGWVIVYRDNIATIYQRQSSKDHRGE